jgi:DNA primase
MDLKEEIRSRLSIDQLVAQYCQLKKKGRNFVCQCPFHNDSHPSFLVSPDKGIAYCFVCQSGGDIFSFFMKIENVDFPTSVKMLAEQLAIDTTPYLQGKASTPSITKDEKERVKECLKLAQIFYTESFNNSPEARAYIEKRNVPAALIEKFGIGYSPDSFSATYDHLLKQGCSRSDIVKAGLGIQKELEQEKIYDRFRHRIMMPICDAQGVIIGFGGRALGESDAKYINSPEGILYNKSTVLFGLHHAKEAIRTEKKVILVEGYFDVIACHKAGLHNVVAVSGTALTEQHVSILKRYATDVILALDQDDAGRKAAERSYTLLAPHGLSISTVHFDGKDPDDIAREKPEELNTLFVQNIRPYLPSLIEEKAKRSEMSDAHVRRRVIEELFPLFASISSATELRDYIQQTALLCGMVESDVLRDFQQWKKGNHLSPQKSDQPTATLHQYSSIELCLGIAVLYPITRPVLRELISADDAWVDSMQNFIAKTQAETISAMMQERGDVDAVAFEKLSVLALYCEEHFSAWSDSMALHEMRKMVERVNKETIAKKQKKIIEELKKAKADGDVLREQELLNQYQLSMKLTTMAEKG